MTEEQFLNLREKRSFRVPDGYFDHLTERVMAKIPEELPVKKRKLFIFRHPVWAAACMAALIGGVSLFFMRHTPETAQNAPIASAGVKADAMTTDEIQVAADNLMIDDDELYAYMSESY